MQSIEQEATNQPNIFTQRVKEIGEALGIDTRTEPVKRNKKVEMEKNVQGKHKNVT